jgi:flagellar basal body P-ring protein FlgI
MDNTVLRTVLLIITLAVPSFATSRIKDIGHFAGVRSNP